MDLKERSCERCMRGVAHCGMCGDELERFIPMSSQTEEEERMDVVAQNGNDGLHYPSMEIPMDDENQCVPGNMTMLERLIRHRSGDQVAMSNLKPKTDTERKTALDLLNAAADIMQQRAEQYDKPEGERSMGAAVQAFNTITGRDMKESEGWLLLQVLKDVRQWQRPDYHADSAEDCIAYSALKAEALAKGL